MRKLSSKPLIILFIFIAALVFFYLFKQTPATEEQDTAHRREQEAVVAKAKFDVHPASQDTTTASGPAGTPTGDDPSKTVVIQNWILAESKVMNQPHVDTKQKDLELKKTVENYSDEEKKVILSLALDTSKTANERILAAYMTVLDQSTASVENLGQLATKALPDFGPVTAHSEAEIRRGQELAVRYMAVDELGRRASTNPQALEELKKLVTTGESAEVRGYAQRILAEKK